MDNKKTILIVDDSETNVMLLRNIVEGAGYNAIAASNGKEALSTAEKVMPDMILLDLMMPYVNGFKFLEMVKEIEKLKQIPVYVITAKIETSELRKAVQLGAEGYMVKPIKIKRLKETISQLIT